MIGRCFFGLCIISVVFALLSGNPAVLTNAVIDGAAKSVSLTLSLTGMMVLWCGMMRVFTACGVMDRLTRWMAPLLRHIFPNAWKTGVAKNEITAAITANLLGIGNAATPYAIRAMEEMDAANPSPTRATDDMVTFAVLGASSLNLIPTTLITLRRAAGSRAPYQIIVPVWIVSALCAFCGVLLSRLLSKTTGGEKGGTAANTENPQEQGKSKKRQMSKTANVKNQGSSGSQGPLKQTDSGTAKAARKSDKTALVCQANSGTTKTAWKGAKTALICQANSGTAKTAWKSDKTALVCQTDSGRSGSHQESGGRHETNDIRQSPQSMPHRPKDSFPTLLCPRPLSPVSPSFRETSVTLPRADALSFKTGDCPRRTAALPAPCRKCDRP